MPQPKDCLAQRFSFKLAAAYDAQVRPDRGAAFSVEKMVQVGDAPCDPIEDLLESELRNIPCLGGSADPSLSSCEVLGLEVVLFNCCLGDSIDCVNPFPDLSLSGM